MADMSEQRELNVIFSKSGTGSPTTKLAIPISWCQRMDITEDDRSIYVYYDDNKKQITIMKK